jgi:hypothetical protein
VAKLKKRGRKKSIPEDPVFRIKQLDPAEKCGPATSVELLFRVDESIAGGTPPRSHLVFFDRHGWYCEHGRDCVAVAQVRRHGKHNHGPTTNGRMRA